MAYLVESPELACSFDTGAHGSTYLILVIASVVVILIYFFGVQYALSLTAQHGDMAEAAVRRMAFGEAYREGRGGRLTRRVNDLSALSPRLAEDASSCCLACSRQQGGCSWVMPAGSETDPGMSLICQ